MKKICSKCGEKKDVGEFHKSKGGKYGVRADCKVCNRERNKDYVKNNRDKILQRRRESYKENKDVLLKEAKKWRKDNKEHIKEYNKKWREENREHIKKYNKKYKAENKEELNKYQKLKYHKKLKHDPLFKLARVVRFGVTRVMDAVKQDKELRSLEYLGCSLEEFKSHIESLWLDGMSWDNHGDWHIDHKVPLDWYVKNSDDPWEANHYTNLQPLWAAENLSKGSSI